VKLSLGLKIQLDIASKKLAETEYLKFVEKLSLTKINLGVMFNPSEINNMKSQIDILQKQFSQAFKGGVEPITVIAKEIANVSKTMDGMQSKQVKLIDGSQVQVVETIKKSLIETQKIIANYSKGGTSITDISSLNYAKAQKSLYGELNKLQKDEFTLKGEIIGKDGLIKNELEKQLGLVKQQQTEVGKLVNSYNLRSEDNISKNLKDRAVLTSDLIIKQEKYNQSLTQSSYKDASSNLKQINTLQNQMAKAGENSKVAIQGEISTLENKNKELYKTLDLQQLVNLKTQESKNNTKTTAKVEDTQQNNIYKESQTLLTQIYAVKERILKTDQNDIATLGILKSQQSDLLNKQSNNLGQVSSLDNLIRLKQQEIGLERELNTVKAQQTFKVDQGEIQRIAKLGELKNVLPKDLFGKTNAEIKEFMQNLVGGDAKITQFKRSADTLANANVKMTISTMNSKNEILQENLVLDRNTNSLYKNGEEIKNNTSRNVGFVDRLKTTLVAFTSFATVGALLRKAFQEFKSGVTATIELDSALTTINMTMDMTKNDMRELTTQSQNMAREMGLSINEVLNAVKVYANANENVASILEKTRADIMLATASGMDTTSTTDGIQAIMNQFEMEATGSAERIADTLEKVSANMPMDFGSLKCAD
jgi:hypothetical protein